MKKTIMIMLCAALLLCLLPVSALASAGDLYNDGTFQYTELADGTLSVTGYVGGGGAVVIPLAYDPGGGSMAVTAIGANAFNDQDTITSVTIPSSVTWIGDYAFEDCSSLNSVTLSPGLTVIGYYMFHACDALASVTIPSSVTSIGRSAFYHCDSLSSVTLSDGLSTLGIAMFYNCDALASITIPSSVTTIGDSAFAYCNSLSSVTLSPGLTVLGAGMFSGCDALTSITIPSSVTTSGDYVCQYCSLLQKAVILSKTVPLMGSFFSETNIAADGIYGFSGSTAQAYAAANTVPFHTLLEVAYDSQGGSSLPSDYVLASGDTVEAPDDPTLDGHVFGGWYPTAACDTTAVTFPYAVTADTVLYAKWTAEYTVAFDSNGGSAVDSQTVLSGGKATEPDDPTLSGQVFDGWYADETLTDAWDFDADTVSAEVTLYAKWTELSLASSVAGGRIYTGGRITLTPNVDGGTWDWDHSFFSATFNSPATFTALKTGTSTITYTAGGVSVTYDVTIEASEVPNTGQDFTWAWAFCGAALILVAGTVALKRKAAKQ